VIPAFRAATTNTARALELVRMVLMFLVLGGLVMYPVELILIGHWISDNWQAMIPFYLTIPAVVMVAWSYFDRTTPWVRWTYIIVMWVAVVVGVMGAYYHWVYNMEDFRGVRWDFIYSMEQFHGYRPVLAALAYTNMGVTGLAAIFRAR
jgi:drug/metabolite transporter (DMT)-like permease